VAADSLFESFMQAVERVLERVTELPFSPVAAKILQLAHDERVGCREIASLVAQDQAFTARLLKIANSPYYGQTRAVTTVSQAVPVLGIDTVSSLALALVSFSSLAHDHNPILTLWDLWEHSVGCAVWGRQIARRIGQHAEEAFIAGLLHDMGKALFYRFFKSEFLEAVKRARADGIELLASERTILGTDHAVAGAAVARKWNLPPLLLNTIEYHHQPLTLGEDVDIAVRKTAAMIHVADALSDQYQIGCGVESAPEAISDETWHFLGINQEICASLLGSVIGEVNEFRHIFDVSPGVNNPRPRSQASINPGLNRAEPVAMAPQASTALNSQSGNSTMPTLAPIIEAGRQLALLAGLDALYPNIAAQAMSLVDADAAHVFLPHEEFLEAVGSAGMSMLNGRRFPWQRSLIGWVARMGEMMVVADVAKATASWEKDFFSAAGLMSHLFFPVEWAVRRLAVLCLHSTKLRHWTVHEISRINMYVGFVSVALENARLYREAEDKAKALEGLNQQLAAALHVKTRFLATVSHELRTPLVVISGYANLMAEQTVGPLPPGAMDAVDKIIKRCNLLMSMISDLIEISQMESGSLKLRRDTVELAELLDEVTGAMRQLLGDRPILFETDYQRDGQTIVADRQRLRQLLGHLLDNAAKFTHEGRILLSARVNDSGAEIIVEDTGIGIETEHQNFIFDSFHQVDNQDDRRHEGMGIGLYLARRVVEMLGGEITVESAVGSGSRFRVWLPREVHLPQAESLVGGSG
jgi:putative nucleotidyltransferase with HDIG domain